MNHETETRQEQLYITENHEINRDITFKKRKEDKTTAVTTWSKYTQMSTQKCKQGGQVISITYCIPRGLHIKIRFRMQWHRQETASSIPGLERAV